MRTDRTRLVNHVVALLAVLAAVAIRAAVLGSDGSAAFMLSSVAVAAAAWIGGVSPGIVATLAAVLAARVLSRVDLMTAVGFTVEGLLITALAARASTAITTAAGAIASADARIRDLLGVQQRLRRIDDACLRLEQVARECAALVVDERGRIIEWRDGATRLLGWSADAIRGQMAAQLLEDTDENAFERLLAPVPHDGGSRWSGVCRRADGTSFDAEAEIHRVGDAATPAFVVVIRDRSREQEWRAFTAAAADLQKTLRDEADVAQRQLATLQCFTDPALNLMPASQAVTALLDRLQAAIDADGVALIRSGRQRRRVLTATDGLQPEAAAERRHPDGWAPQAGRILIVHNDPARVTAASAVGWRDEAASLIAVPVVSGSHVDGTIEVIGVKPRRSTEWEIALVQVVAAQVAARLQSESFFGADAVA